MWLGFLLFTPHLNSTLFLSNGIRYQLGTENSDYIEPVSISVNGEMKKSITGVRTFTGTIDIEDEIIPVPEIARDLEIKFDEDGSGTIFYAYVDNNGMPQHYYLGDILVSDDFSELTIMVSTKDGDSSWGWNGANGTMITAPASSRDEALEISKRLMEDIMKGLKPLK